MFPRSNRIATSTLWLVTLTGVSSIVNGADTKPIVLDTCTQCESSSRQPLILASYTDARGGQALVRGRTELARELLSTKTFGRSSAAELTNMCVAQTVLRQLSQAGEACDAAVARALAERASTSRWPGAYREAVHTAVGAAYSNRAVMHWLSGNELAAHEDLVRARDFSPNASYVMRNQEVTERGPSSVRTMVAQPRIG
jgi:hypothetical protein